MTKLGKAEREARTVPAKVTKADRPRVLQEATARVKAKVAIDFRREVRD